MEEQSSLLEGITVEEVFSKCIGSWGPGQWRVTAVMDYKWLVSALHIYLMVIVEGDPVAAGDWRCVSDDDSMCNTARGMIGSKDGKEAFCGLEDFQWEWTHRESSVVSYYDLQCSSYKVGMLQSLYFFGWMLGSAFWGYLADRFGRLPIFYIANLVLAAATVVCALSPSFCIYLIFRAISGFGLAETAGFVISTELLGASKRGVHTFFCNLVFVAGACIILPLSILVRSWRTLTYVVALLLVPLYLFFWYIPESPRWLVLNKHTEEARLIMQNIAHLNKKTMPEERLVESSHETNNLALLQLVKNLTLLKCFAITLFHWMVACILYYGLSLVLDSLPGTFFFKFLSICVVQVPANLLFMFMADCIGRRALCAGGFLVGGLGCLFVTFVPKQLPLLFAIVGKFGISGSFSLLYIYTIELFPTSARNSILGASSLSARVGGVLAPQISILTRIFGPKIPFAIFGSLGVLAAVLSLFLPETMGKPMPEAMDEALKLQCQPRHMRPAEDFLDMDSGPI